VPEWASLLTEVKAVFVNLIVIIIHLVKIQVIVSNIMMKSTNKYK
jgi:hypothetical protein